MIEHQLNPTLAQIGGLPPARPDEKLSERAANANVNAQIVMHSHVITRKSASNLALAFLLLPRAKRDAMSALYAFCREVDDVADNESAPAEKRREQLAAWRADVRRACAGETPQFIVNRELQPVIREYRLPFPLFDELLKGCEMDFDIKRYENFEQLELYCYRVASVVGLLSIEIFGYQNPGVPRLRRLSRQGAATDQHFARRENRRRARPDLSAAGRTEKIRRHAEDEILRSRIFRPFCATGRRRRRARQDIFTGWRGKPCPPKTATPWSPPN